MRWSRRREPSRLLVAAEARLGSRRERQCRSSYTLVMSSYYFSPFLLYIGREGNYTGQQPSDEDKGVDTLLMQQHEPKKTSIISLCAPSDRQGLQRWEAHLQPLEQTGILSFWSVDHLEPGADRS